MAKGGRSSVVRSASTQGEMKSKGPLRTLATSSPASKSSYNLRGGR